MPDPLYALVLPHGPAADAPALAAHALAATSDARRLLLGSGGTNYVMAAQCNIAATAAPGTGDDSADGYSPGSLWIDTTADKSYVCVDSTVGAAVWQQTSGTGTGGITQLTGDATAGPGSGSQALTLAASGVSAGSYGSATAVPVLTFDAKGRCTSATTASVASGGTVPNVLHNGGFEVWQRGTSNGTTDGGYYADRWYTLFDTTTPVVSRQTGTLGARYALRLLQQDATARRMGEAQVAEACDSIPYRGRDVRFQFKAKASTSTAIRFAILEWTGTADSVTRDVVNNWASGTYTAGSFFLGSNLTVVAVGSGTATTSFGSFSVTGTVSSSCNNLIVFVWTESAVAQNVTLDITECGLYDGTAARDWLPRPVAEELGLCQRYFYKSYDLDTAPGTVTDTGALGYAAAGTAGEYGPTVTYPVRMRATPTYTIYSTNTGASGKRYDASAGADDNLTAFNLSGPGSHSGANTAHTAGRVYRYHFTASAEL